MPLSSKHSKHWACNSYLKRIIKLCSLVQETEIRLPHQDVQSLSNVCKTHFWDIVNETLVMLNIIS